ncbi:MAG: DAK2 domain-containing protein [Actinomycetota bacterium]|nr:DAK2 domain-containing protein [Actinomycetota bacterium]
MTADHAVTAELSAPDLRRALEAALQDLRAAKPAIDAMNVYPVPDADTGTNLVLTFESIARAAADAGERSDEIARALRSGALMGARGNSGVIASQIVQAWAEHVEAGPADVELVARAFKRALESAFEAVLHPAEGTILSVLRAASEGAQGDHASVAQQFESAARTAIAALERTPEQMPLLARAGVVDAGGAGLVVVLAAMARALGADIAAPSFRARATSVEPTACGDPPTFAYEVMYLLEAPDERVPPLRELLGTIGDSVAVTGGRGMWRVHVHTDLSERAITLGRAIGRTSDISVVSFEEQMAEGRRGIALASSDRSAALVAVARGKGNRRMLEELGATVVAAAADVRAAIERAPRDYVLVLPDGARARDAALEAAHALHKTVIVMPAVNAAAALSVAAVYSDARPAEDSVADMNEALARLRFATPARDRLVDEVRALLAKGPAELVTVVCGEGVEQDERDAVAGELARAFPSLTLETYDGGQAAPFAVAVE